MPATRAAPPLPGRAERAGAWLDGARRRRAPRRRHHRPGQPRRRAARGGGPADGTGGRAARAAAAAASIGLVHGSLSARASAHGAERAAAAHRPRAVRRDPRPAPDERQARRDARPHRQAGPGDHVVHVDHGIARYVGMTQRTFGDDVKEYLQLDFAGHRQDLPAGRADRAHHALRRRTGAAALEARRDRVGADEDARAPRGRRPGARADRDLRRARVGAGLRLQLRHHLAARARGELPVHRDARPGAQHRGGQGRHAPPPADGSPRGRRRRLRQDRGRPARRLQGGPGRQAGRGAGADDGAGPAAPAHLRAPPRRLPGAGRDAQPLRRAQASRSGSSRAWPTGRSTCSSGRIGSCRRTSPSPTSGCSSSTRSSASASPTRSASRPCGARSTC